MEKERFHKRKGTCGVDGQMYEIKLAMLAYLQCIISWCSGDIKRFRIGSNLSMCGDFDDVFVEYTNRDDSICVHLIQAKYRIDKTKAPTCLETLFSANDKNDFSLRKYFKSYVEGADLIIYTNNMFNPIRGCEHIEELELDGFLEQLSSSRQRYRIVCSEYVYSALKHSTDFFTLLSEITKAISCQQIDMSKLIIKKFCHLLNAHVYEVDLEKGLCSFRKSFIERNEDALLDVRELRDEILKKYDVKVLYKPLKVFNPSIINQFCDSHVLVYRKKFVEDFLSSFKLFFNQLDVDKIEKRMKDKLTCLYKPDDVNNMYLRTFEKMFDWWRNEDYFLTEKDNFFAGSLLFEFTAKKKATIDQFNVAFDEKSLKELIAILRHCQVVNVSVKKETKFLNIIKLFQALDFLNNKYNYWEIANSHDINEIITFIFRSEISFFILDFTGTVLEFENFLDKFSEQIITYRKKFIIISENHATFKSNIAANYFQNVDNKIKFTDLDDKTRHRLKEKIVDFQGVNMKLQSIINKNSEFLVNQESLVKLITGNIIKIGKPIKKISNLNDVFIDRKLIQKKNVRITCLKDKELKLAISGLYEDYIKFYEIPEKCIFRCHIGELCDNITASDLRIFLLSADNPESDYEKILLVYPEAHWLHFNESSDLIWRQSNGQLNGLRKYLSENIDNSIFTYSSLMEDNNKFVILTAEPGMGKSTLVNKLQESAIDEKEFTWKLRIDLNDHRKMFKSMIAIDETSVYEFLKNTVNLESDFECNLFHYEYFEGGRMILFFDGFDEICTDFKKQVTEILIVLKKSRAKKILITTRLHESEHLENELHTFAYSLCPLSKIEQQAFLQSRVNRHLEYNDFEKCQLILANFFVSIENQSMDQLVLGNPLHLSIISEYIFQNLKDENELLDSIWSWRLLDLYENFLKRKFYDIYCEDKGNARDSELRDLIYDSFIQHKKIKALAELFGDEAISRLGIKLKDSADQKWLKIGVVHRTFDEYLAGVALFDEYSSNRQRTVEFFKRVCFYSPRFEVVRRFFDSACGSAIHEAVLGRKLMDYRYSADVEKRDIAGRTALHLAISHSNLPAFRGLIQLGADLKPKDEIHGWSPIAYAIFFRNLQALYMLILLDASQYDEALDSLRDYTGVKNSTFDEIAELDLRILIHKQLFLTGVNETSISHLVLKSCALDERFPIPLHVNSNAIIMGEIELNKRIVIKTMTAEFQKGLADNQLHRTSSAFRPKLFNSCSEGDTDVLNSRRSLLRIWNAKDLYTLSFGDSNFTFLKVKDVLKRPEKIIILLVRVFLDTIEAPMVDSNVWGKKINLKDFKIELDEVNETNVRKFVADSLFFKQGRDAESFYRYFKEGELILVFFDLVVLNMNDMELLYKLMQTICKTNSGKFCIVTRSNIILYHMDDPSTEVSHDGPIFDIVLRDLDNILFVQDKRFLREYFDLNKLHLFLGNQDFKMANYTQKILRLIRCLNANVGVNIELDLERDDFKVDDQFLMVELDWQTIKNILNQDDGKFYCQIHQHFVEKCEEKLEILMNNEETRLLFDGYEHLEFRYKPSFMEMLRILRSSKLGKIIVTASPMALNDFYKEFDPPAYLENVNSIDLLTNVLRKQWDEFLKFKEVKSRLLFYHFIAEFQKLNAQYDVAPFLDAIVEHFTKILKENQQYPFGAELVLLEPMNYIDLK